MLGRVHLRFEFQVGTLARTNLLGMKNAGSQWTMVSYLKK